ncbi:hypothetical protein HID58_094114 [Brassica napus]|uniref:Uncharacterized protein n=1 Tax=Brassica napus TaxID=3708 RepID=A0ABQ7X8J0_BRANA|nr:hypothetical protein HID58_094114 [Brassica napus]
MYVFGSTGLWKISKDNATDGLNYYVTQYATTAPRSTQPNVITDARVTLDAPSFVYYPPGIRQILNYIKNNYGNPLPTSLKMLLILIPETYAARCSC